jgi:hypothetical protein
MVQMIERRLKEARWERCCGEILRRWARNGAKPGERYRTSQVQQPFAPAQAAVSRSQIEFFFAIVHGIFTVAVYF